MNFALATFVIFSWRETSGNGGVSF